jgi:hypothetical protein
MFPSSFNFNNKRGLLFCTLIFYIQCQFVISIQKTNYLYHYTSCHQGVNTRIDEIKGHSYNAPIGKVFGDKILNIPKTSLSGDYQVIKWNITLNDYTICLSGKYGTLLSSNNNNWHLSFTSSDFGYGNRSKHPEYFGDHWQIVCATNHPDECNHINTHKDVCINKGGEAINGLKLHSNTSLWEFHDLLIYDRHLSHDEILDVSHDLWTYHRFDQCKIIDTNESDNNRRLMQTMTEKQEYIFNQTSNKVFLNSYGGISILSGGISIVILVIIRLFIFNCFSKKVILN